MSPVFRHGRLRLYLLKLLDESPRHGYEVIRLLQDRFMGVYAPSPGTIYPRLARLEEDGLVTHEEVDGKKVYSITDKGREEIKSRLGDLADLEDELTESLRDVAREISEDVRDTVRTIREELASAAREFRTTQDDKSGKDTARPSGERTGESAEAHRIREEARRNREQMRASFREQGRSHGDWAAWQERAGGWGAWTDWIGGPEDWFGAGKAGRKSGGGSGQADAENAGTPGDSDNAGAAKAGLGSSGGPGSGGAGSSAGGAGKRTRRGGQNPFSDLERMAFQFATELRAAAKQTGTIGERSLSDLRDILTDTLAKVRVEVFSDSGSGDSGSGDSGSGDSGSGDSPAGPASQAGRTDADTTATDSGERTG